MHRCKSLIFFGTTLCLSDISPVSTVNPFHLSCNETISHIGNSWTSITLDGWSQHTQLPHLRHDVPVENLVPVGQGHPGHELLLSGEMSESSVSLIVKVKKMKFLTSTLGQKVKINKWLTLNSGVVFHERS